VEAVEPSQRGPESRRRARHRRVVRGVPVDAGWTSLTVYQQVPWSIACIHRKRPWCSRQRDTELDTHKMLGVVDGLSYLHLNYVVHGDLKGVSYID